MKRKVIVSNIETERKDRSDCIKGVEMMLDFIGLKQSSIQFQTVSGEYYSSVDYEFIFRDSWVDIIPKSYPHRSSNKGPHGISHVGKPTSQISYLKYKLVKNDSILSGCYGTKKRYPQTSHEF